MGKLKRHLKEVINKTWNFGGQIKDSRGDEMNAIIGLAAEAGEVLDLGKKRWFHTPKFGEMDTFREKLILELGDVFYYLIKVMSLFDITLKEVLAKNREKLESRHPELGKVTERFNGSHIR